MNNFNFTVSLNIYLNPIINSMGNERCYAYFKILSFMGCIRGIFYEWFHSKFFWIHWVLSNSNNNKTQPLTEEIYKTESLPIKH